MFLYSFLNFITPIWLKDIFDFLDLWSIFKIIGRWLPFGEWLDLTKISFIYYPMKTFICYVGYSLWMNIHLSDITPKLVYDKINI